MSCPGCGSEPDPRARFCSTCGHPLRGAAVPACSRCGKPSVPRARFCWACGLALSAGIEGGQRRHMTVMFCDLVGSTRLSAERDPEELHDLVRRYHEAAARAVARYEGHVAQYLGDGVLAFFGYPIAHEDDAERAVHAGLAILHALGDLNTGLESSHGLRLGVRIAAHSGETVVAGTGQSEEREQAFGHTMNVAARLQEVAQTDTMVVSDATRRLLRDTFELRPLGAHALKGVDTPVEAHHVIGLRKNAPGDEVRAVFRTPLVGREVEVEQLRAAWAEAHAGRARAVEIEAEPGMGKSRLLADLRLHVGDRAGWLETAASPYFQHSPFHPVAGLLTRAARIAAPATPAIAKGALRTMFGEAPADDVEALTAVLGASADGSVLSLGATDARRRALDLLSRWLLASGQERPTLLVFEDLHWMDPSTLEVIERVLAGLDDQRILVVLTHRPTFSRAWRSPGRLERMRLGPLDDTAVRNLVDRVAGADMPADLLRQIVSRTDGVPLFVEELTHMVLESDWLERGPEGYEVVGAVPSLAIPATLHDSLMARLDRMDDAKTVAQIASAIGREVPRDLLHGVVAGDASWIDGCIEQLVAAELMRIDRAQESPRYVFHHALVQEAAYRSLLKGRRREIHARILDVLPRFSPEVGERAPELLAHHAAGAGRAGEAIEFLLTAGQIARYRSAHAEAVAFLEEGLALVYTIDDPAEAARRELALQVGLCEPLMAVTGPGSPRAVAAVSRARELCERLGAAPEAIPVLRGLAQVHLARADYPLARELSEQMLRSAERAGNHEQMLEALRTLGIVLFFWGDARAAHDALMRGVEMSRERAQRATPAYGDDAGVSCRSWAAITLHLLGDARGGVAMMHEALSRAERLDHPYTRLAAHVVAGILFWSRDEPARVREQVEPALALAQAGGFPFWIAVASGLDAWALAQQGENDRARTRADEFLRAIEETATAGMGRSALLTMAFVALGRAGEPERARKLLREGLEHAERAPERFILPEALRLEGMELLAEGAEAEAAAYFRRALEISRAQKLRPFELRSALCLARVVGPRAHAEEVAPVLRAALASYPADEDLSEVVDARRWLSRADAADPRTSGPTAR